MSILINTSTSINHDAAQITPPEHSLTAPSRITRDPPEASAIASREFYGESAEAEILTLADIEILKLHALRRSKEYLEERLKKVSEAFAGSHDSRMQNSAVAEYNALYKEHDTAPSLAATSDENTPLRDERTEIFYKATEAITNYKLYKKDTPKAWDDGDIDERR